MNRRNSESDRFVKNQAFSSNDCRCLTKQNVYDCVDEVEPVFLAELPRSVLKGLRTGLRNAIRIIHIYLISGLPGRMLQFEVTEDSADSGYRTYGAGGSLRLRGGDLHPCARLPLSLSHGCRRFLLPSKLFWSRNRRK